MTRTINFVQQSLASSEPLLDAKSGRITVQTVEYRPLAGNRPEKIAFYPRLTAPLAIRPLEPTMTDASILPVRHGVVAVVVRENRLLVIRRSVQVTAPRAYCFPGGGIEPGETEEQALVREMDEELGTALQPVRCLWRSRTARNVQLAWWLAELPDETVFRPEPAEVESFHWLTSEEMLALPDLLESNREFMWAAANRDFTFSLTAHLSAAERGIAD
jgi:8-oxo-dGTP diphosphatase